MGQEQTAYRFGLALLAALFLLGATAHAQQYDLLLKGGHVIDPKNGIDAVRDVAVKDDRIAAISADIPAAAAKQTVSVQGLYVTPGAIDLHTHLFASGNVPAAWAGDYSVMPDGFSFRSCTTTMVDAGSSGYRNFEQFYGTVIARARTRVLAMINIAGYGMLTDAMEQDPEDMLPKEVAKLAARYKDVVVGVKSAHYQKPDWTSVDRAVEAGKLANIPVMVDFGYFLPERPYWKLVTERLRPGDISTHMYRATVPWIDDKGKVYPYLYEARKRGVKFDVGHGGGSFVMRNGAPAIAQGFYPDTISTDLHYASMNAGLMDLPTTASKLMALGMPLKDAFLRLTWNPAQVIHRPELGHLSVGAPADIAVWNLLKGDFGYRDAAGGVIKGRERLTCEMTVRAGGVVWDWNSRIGDDYRKLPPDYGIRPGVDTIVKP